MYAFSGRQRVTQAGSGNVTRRAVVPIRYRYFAWLVFVDARHFALYARTYPMRVFCLPRKLK